MTQPTDEQVERIRSALAEHDRVIEVGDEAQPGLMGYNIPIILDRPIRGFRFHVEEVEVNAVFSIMTVQTPEYQSDFPEYRHADVLHAVIEVRRWPEV